MIPCIIPARGGSKGIRGKNLMQIGGKPLIAWSIDQALRASLVDEVVVATDDNRIAAIAAEFGAKVFRRSEASATDHAASELVLKEVLLERYPHVLTAVVFLQATSPVRRPRDIDTAIETLIDTEADSVFSARVVDGYTWREGPGTVSPTYSNRVPRQSQSVRTLEENGSIYVFRQNVIWDYDRRLGGKVVPYVMHPLDSFQLDEPEDIPIIEKCLEVRLGCRNAAAA